MPPLKHTRMHVHLYWTHTYAFMHPLSHTDGRRTTQKHNAFGPIYIMGGGIKTVACRHIQKYKFEMQLQHADEHAYKIFCRGKITTYRQCNIAYLKNSIKMTQLTKKWTKFNLKITSFLAKDTDTKIASSKAGNLKIQPRLYVLVLLI